MPSDTCILSWLEHLWQLYPAQGVLVVGAGNGSSPLIDALQRWNAPSVTLVEADDAQFQHLQRNLLAREGWQLRKQVVAAESGNVTYHQASSPAESGLVEPENLRALWPNLKTRQKSTRQAISLAELLPLTEPASNWLMLDCLPAGALLTGAGDALASFDVIVTRSLLPEVYADTQPVPQADLASVEQALQAHGFRTLAIQRERHPGVAHVLHVRDRNAQLANLNAELSQAREALQTARAGAEQVKAQAAQAQAATNKIVAERERQLQALQVELANAQQSSQQAVEQTAQLNQQVAAVQTAMEKWREAAEKARADAEQAKHATQQAMDETSQTQQQLTVLQTEIDQAIAERERLRKAQKDALSQVQVLQQEKAELAKSNEFEVQALSKIESLHKIHLQLDKQIKDSEKIIRNELSQRSSNIIKQIEAFIGVQNYFNSGELIGLNVERNSWPISFDFAFYLVQLLELNNYDVVIEFGSGISTVVVAKTLAKISNLRNDRAPAEFISFDHLEKYYSQTLAQLKQAKVSDLVQLHHKPLWDYITSSGSIQPFYECEAILADLARRHNPEELRILVIVDGPPSATGPMARYPAGPIVHSLFKGARIDILLDDYVRDDEKKIAALWQQDLQMAGVNFTAQELKLEKDACLISI